MKIKIKNLEFSYKNQNVFKNINIELEEGEIFSLLGVNGTGKTTLLKCINRLNEPKNGKIYIDGKDVTEIKIKEIAKRIAFVPQAEEVKFPVSVFDAVLLGRKPYIGWKETARDLDKVFNILCQLNLQHLADKDLDSISGGERQKVMIAKAMVQDADILLLDEPTTYLDLGYQIMIMDFIKEHVKKNNITCIFTSHDMNYALSYSDSIGIMDSGEIVHLLKPEDVTPEIIKEIYKVESSITSEKERLFLHPYKYVGRK